MKTFKRIALGIVAVLIALFIYLATYRPPLSERHGRLDTKLYLSDSLHQPLIVAFGGGSGGNDWARHYLKEKRDEFLRRGYGILAIGYFKSGEAPDALDRISLNAISDTILHIARRNPQIDTNKIVLMGGSKGGELVLNLASRFDYIKGVIALSTSHVSFPALTMYANTSSWTYQDAEVPYVPAPVSTIGPALKGDLYGAFSMMLADTAAVRHAAIEVEKINGPIIIISPAQDEQWPSASMGEQLEKRLREKNFSYPFEHHIVPGTHVEPLTHFEKVYRFLEEHVGR